MRLDAIAVIFETCETVCPMYTFHHNGSGQGTMQIAAVKAHQKPSAPLLPTATGALKRV